MTAQKKSSPKTIAALAVLRSKKLDLFAKCAIAAFVFTFALLELTFFGAIKGSIGWDKFLEGNGVALSMFGALWTALGVRVSPQERQALIDIRKNSAVVTEEIIHSITSASYFATLGAYCLLIGGVLLSVKVWFFH